MSALDADVREFVRTAVDDYEFLSWLGWKSRRSSPDGSCSESRTPRRSRTRASATVGRSTISVVATFVDTAGGLAIRAALDDPIATEVATIDLNVSYLRRAADGEASAVAAGRGSFRIFRA